NGERLFIQRRRNGWSQERMALECGMYLRTYTLCERGQLPVSDAPAVGRLTALEKCVLARRRRGMTQEDLAEAMGRSRLWVNRAEKGLMGRGELERYWGVRQR